MPGQAIFLGHGSPLNAIADNDFTAALRAWSQSRPRPEAILVISAHWLTQGTFVSCQPQPRQIYDFYGFPPELYQVDYPCPGGPALANQVVGLLQPEPTLKSGERAAWSMLGSGCSTEWGIDHAAWAVLKHMYPRADVPVVELSLDMSKPPQYHYQLGRKLRPLRRQNILILGSGNLVHNLALISWEPDAPAPKWVGEMDAKLKDLLLAGDHAGLTAFPDEGRHARLGIPTLDHYLPLLYILGVQAETEKVKFIYEGIQNATVSMRGFELA